MTVATVDPPLERDGTITITVRRGSFRLPRKMQAEEPDAWARRFAEATPHGATVTSSRDGDDEVYRWRVVTTHRRDW